MLKHGISDEMTPRMSCLRFSFVGAAVIYFCFNVVLLWYQIPLQSVADPCFCECAATTVTTLSERSKMVFVTEQHSVSNPSPSSSARSESLNLIHKSNGPVIEIPNGTLEDWDPHTLAVVVPFRDRYEEVFEFAPYMRSFLNRQKVRHEFWVINQVDTHRQVGNKWKPFWLFVSLVYSFLLYWFFIRFCWQI